MRGILQLIALTSLALCGSTACAQNTRSQLGTVTLWIAGTGLEIVYRRPVARGRPLFGSLVKWGDIWTPSADSAARITVSNAVEIAGSRLAAGTYGLWMIPDSTQWTLIFTSVAEAHHLRYPRDHDVLRVHAIPARGDHVETLAFVLPVVDADSAVLQMRWGTTIVPVTIRAK